MSETSGYLSIIEESLKRKVPRGKYVGSCDIKFNNAQANTFEITDGDTPRQVRSVLNAFMEHYHQFIKNITITQILENDEADIRFEVPQDKQYEFVKVLDAIYTGVKNEAEEAKAILEDAKKDL